MDCNMTIDTEFGFGMFPVSPKSIDIFFCFNNRSKYRIYLQGPIRRYKRVLELLQMQMSIVAANQQNKTSGNVFIILITNCAEKGNVSSIAMVERRHWS